MPTGQHPGTAAPVGVSGGLAHGVEEDHLTGGTFKPWRQAAPPAYHGHPDALGGKARRFLGEQVIATAHDTAVTDRDPSRHAEANAIRAAAAQLDDADLCGCLLFSTCEPCPMCSSMAVWANVSAVVFGASIDATAARGKARITIPAAEVIARSPALVEVYPGVLGAECTELY